jgi:hypothetical protein
MVPEDPRNRASVRVKFLIKNMFDNKAKNWEKTKSEDTQVKKKAEIANQVTKKAEEKRKMEMGARDEYSGGGGRGGYSDRN